jgi:ribonuclease BN (tRNA processing enzyme)
MTYLINDTIAIDAGCLGLLPNVSRQRDVRNIFISHSHIDHIATLPLFLDNVYEYGQTGVRIHAGQETIDSLRNDIFNERVWPDLVRLSREESSFLEFLPLSSQQSVTIGDIEVRAVSLNHVVPTFGFVITENQQRSIAIVSDTGPTSEIWHALDNAPGPRAALLDVSFPNRLCWLAEKSKHLCPQLARAEIAKVRSTIDWHIIHLKPAFRDEIVAELQTVVPQALVTQPGEVLLFE